MKFPLSPEEYVEHIKTLVQHDAALRDLIPKKEEEVPIFADLPEEGELSEAELAKTFKEEKSLKKMSMAEIDATPVDQLKILVKKHEEEEESADNANDLYRVAARVKNLARGSNMNLTPQGEMLCNTFVHVLRAFYDFAEKIPDQTLKSQLNKLIRDQEGMPGSLIASAGAGVTMKKGEKRV